MRIITPKKAKVFFDQFNQTLQTAGVQKEGGSSEPPKDKHGRLPTRILQSVLDMQARLAEGIETKTRLTVERKKAGHAVQAKQEKLNRTIRNVWTVIRQRVSRGELPESIFTAYGLMANGNNPTDLSTSQWPVYAETLIEAEAQIAAQGHVPTSAPNVAEIREAFDQYTASRTAKNDARGTLTTYNKEVFQQLELDAKRLHQLMMAELRRELLDYTESKKREIMRSYGAEFTTVDSGGTETEPPTENGETTQTPETDGETTASPGMNGDTTDASANDSKTAEPAA